MDTNNYAVIMAGGVGSRFWPMSTPARPKQFLDVLGIGKSLLRLTYERLLNIIPNENIYIVTNAEYYAMVKEHLPELDNKQILTEPERKNTAPCIAYAAAKIYALNKEANLIVAPSDHLILQQHKFERIINIALKNAKDNKRITTLGIKPTRPDTGYGYIQFFEEGDVVGGDVKKVKQFTEKPNKELAKIFLTSGDYCWNSGIFVWTAEVILNALKRFKPELHELFCKDFSVYFTEKEQQYVDAAFHAAENISIDFAVMENARNVSVVLADFDWSDLGTWGSLYEHLEKDHHGNATDNPDIRMIDAHDCLVKLPTKKKAIIQGLDDYIVVETEEKLLILKKSDEQNLKTYLKLIEQENG
ncbi:mannose-1-phosphate guanylyltransferase [Lishizhenia tianjinensis]|nr:mannose-1-phosphate guanylyltransferase [Lishizhenia tianjinensis]